jgi:hypothetical protein
MPRIDPAEQARQDQAALLFSGPLLRFVGLPAPTGVVQTLWSGGALLALFLSSAWILLRLMSLGEYRVGKGLRFDFVAAVTRAAYVSTEAPSTTTSALPPSPLEVLRADVVEVRDVLAGRGQELLAEVMSVAFGEAETVARFLEVTEHTAETAVAAEARACIGRFGDHVLALRAELMRGGASGPEHTARFEADLRDLRGAADALRSPVQASTGTA